MTLGGDRRDSDDVHVKQHMAKAVVELLVTGVLLMTRK